MENKNTIMFGTANSERDKTTFEILSIVYDALEEMLEQMGYIHFLACISLPNEASLALHRKRGYQQVAHFPKIGYKFNRWNDIVWLQKSLDKEARPIKLLKEKE